MLEELEADPSQYVVFHSQGYFDLFDHNALISSYEAKLTLLTLSVFPNNVLYDSMY